MEIVSLIIGIIAIVLGVPAFILGIIDGNKRRLLDKYINNCQFYYSQFASPMFDEFFSKNIAKDINTMSFTPFNTTNIANEFKSPKTAFNFEWNQSFVRGYQIKYFKNLSKEFLMIFVYFKQVHNSYKETENSDFKLNRFIGDNFFLLYIAKPKIYSKVVFEEKSTDFIRNKNSFRMLRKEYSKPHLSKIYQVVYSGQSGKNTTDNIANLGKTNVNNTYGANVDFMQRFASYNHKNDERFFIIYLKLINDRYLVLDKDRTQASFNYHQHDKEYSALYKKIISKHENFKR